MSLHITWFPPMRTNIVLDDDLMREAFALTGIHTKRELIHTALQELIRKHTKKDLIDLAGKIRLQDDFDHKKLRELSRRGGLRRRYHAMGSTRIDAFSGYMTRTGPTI